MNERKASLKATLKALPPIRRIEWRYGDIFAFSTDKVITRSLDLYGEWAQHEVHLLCQYVRPDSFVLDIGANIGTHAIALASRNQRACVVAIEAHPVVYSVLTVNCLQSGIDSLTTRNAVAGSAVRLSHHDVAYHATENVGGCSFKRGQAICDYSNLTDALDDSRFIVPTVSMDLFKWKKPVSLIKIDVEGMEMSVLHGAKGLIDSHKPVIYFETLDILLARCAARFLERRGYSLYWMETHPYNQHNFRENKENVWWRTEMGILGLPEKGRCEGMPPVVGSEQSLPFRLEARTGIAVPADMPTA